MTAAVVSQPALADGGAPIAVEPATAAHAVEWNTFLEERISPKDIEAVITPAP